MFFDPFSKASSYRRATGRLLAIDGDRAALALLGRALTRSGHLVAQCATGREALAMIAARDFDLVLLGTAVPGVPAAQILRELRACPATADVPVISLTERSDSAAAVDALAAGADDHLAKPFDLDLLAARIARMLARSQRIAELKQVNALLDARIATRAVELGEAQCALAATRADRQQLLASIDALSAQVERLSRTSAAR